MNNGLEKRHIKSNPLQICQITKHKIFLCLCAHLASVSPNAALFQLCPSCSNLLHYSIRRTEPQCSNRFFYRKALVSLNENEPVVRVCLVSTSFLKLKKNAALRRLLLANAHRCTSDIRNACFFFSHLSV